MPIGGATLPPRPPNLKPSKPGLPSQNVDVNGGNGSLRAQAEISSRQDTIRRETDIDTVEWTNSAGASSWHHNEMRSGGRLPQYVAPGNSFQNDSDSMVPSSAGLLDDEEGQNWLHMYRGVYLKSADAFFGPIFVALVAVFFRVGLLPFWVALWLVPLMFMLTASLVLVKAAGMPPQLLPVSRLPAGMVATMEAVAEGSFITTILPYLGKYYPLECGLQLILAIISFYLHYRCFALDPGYLPQGPPPPPVPPEQLAAMQAASPHHCLTCNMYKPIRSKHCSACGRCVAEFDHHCPVVANCVGCGNRRSFAGYVFTLLAAEILWLRLVVRFWGQELRHLGMVPPGAGQPSPLVVLRHALTLGRLRPGTAYVTVLVVGITMSTAYLAARQVFCILANLTTNELLLRFKYVYLKTTDGSYDNPFDDGIVSNCVQFWETKRPEWYQLYSARHQGSGETGGVLYAFGLMTRLLRWTDAVRKSREMRTNRREEWLLREYGGVPRQAHAEKDCGGEQQQQDMSV